MKVNVSIGDFSPLLRGPEYLFKDLKNTGVDGIELWIGVKSRWTPKHYLRLSRKYNLPIVSVHQPLWAMTGGCFDEGFFKVAQRLGVQYVTCHPLPGRSLAHPQMQEYFDRLARIQKQTGIHILVENMPQQYRSKLLNRTARLDLQTADVLEVCRAAVAHGLGLTFDTDHAHVARPHKAAWFEETFPAIQNIHLSSFNDGRRHQPLDTGMLDTAGFIRYLKKKQYAGLVTLEVSAPKSITMLNYDFERIKRSAALCKS